MNRYLDMLDSIIDNGYITKNDRTGVGTKSIFGHQLRFNLKDGFPIVTTKRVWFKGVVHELLWMISGSTNIKYLQDNKVHIWDAWADENGDLGPVYGDQWRNFNGVDQIKNVIDRIKTNPSCRRLIVSAWNPAEIEKMKLPPCHFMYQFNVRQGKLDCHMNIRSWDVFLGGPFNIAQYALLTHMVAQITHLDVGDLIISSGNTHIYLNHLDQVKLQLTRTPYNLPELKLNPDIKNIDDFKYEDIELIGYQHHPIIKGDIAV